MSSLIGQKIRELRLARGLTQTQLAEGIVTPSMISQIEAGKAQPSESLLKKLAQRLETPEETLSLTPSKSEAVSKRMEVIETCLLFKRFDEAEQLISNSFDTPAGHVELHYFRAKLYAAKRQFALAYHTVDTALTLAIEQSRHDLLPELFLLQGNILFETGDIEIALHLFDQAKRAFDRRTQRKGILHANICMRLGECHRLLGHEQKARACAEEAATSVAVGEHALYLAQDHLSQALQLLQQGKEKEAGRLAAEARTLHQVVQWIESSLEADLLRIMQMLEQSDLQGADALLSSCLTRGCFAMSETLHTRLQFLFAESLVAHGDLETALVQIDSLIAQDPNTPSVERLHALTFTIRAIVYHDKQKLIALAQTALQDALYYHRLSLAAELSTIVGRAHLRIGQPDLAKLTLVNLDRQIHSVS
ncbi:helix-turn-helix domain-containing protein [Sulfoacidibacillus thermotolerans]|uniref:HTH cro/C1-type domain-containing protein n=1 Tax=Sulfoacidibacillus thermotolerans TaxID=1765684 RepID=A0A2U3D7M7_SULT2|nr:helix-turn-helix transcriptional regulator [Sulfoacidibacillus thermotolerans]PWI57290.1 hypothetical protein BM613_09340 [Sulfoacidibacillus thermotolerans]